MQEKLCNLGSSGFLAVVDDRSPRDVEPGEERFDRAVVGAVRLCSFREDIVAEANKDGVVCCVVR